MIRTSRFNFCLDNFLRFFFKESYDNEYVMIIRISVNVSFKYPEIQRR